MVTRVIGKMDCLTVRAEAPVRPLLETLFSRALAMASTLEGRRWFRTSSILGSSLRPNIVVVDGWERGRGQERADMGRKR